MISNIKLHFSISILHNIVYLQNIGLQIHSNKINMINFKSIKKSGADWRVCTAN